MAHAETVVLEAEKRSLNGTSNNKRLRGNDKLPAVVYGNGLDSINLTLGHKEMLKALEKEQVYTQALQLKIDGEPYSVLLKDVQRHPYKNKIIHVDFLQVNKNTVVTVAVPLHFLNEATSFGVKSQGGLISHQITEVEVKCTVGDLPEFIEVDMQDVKIGETIHLSNLKLPKKASIPSLALGADHNLPVARITVISAEKVEEDEVVVANTTEEKEENKEDK